MRVILIDDEPLARRRLRALLGIHDGIDIVGEATDALEAMRLVEANKPDAIFLDVEMPGSRGVDFADAVRRVCPAPRIVFCTAHAQWAAAAFDLDAIDYVVKPIEAARLARALERLRNASERGTAPDSSQPLCTPRQSGMAERLLVELGPRTVFVNTMDIDWIEAAGNYVRLYVAGQRHLLRRSMTLLDKELPTGSFVRIHRSVIVNLARLAELRAVGPTEHRVLLKDGTQLPLSHRYRRRLRW